MTGSTAGLRVVSLVPSSTETLLELGVDVVACTRFCEQPDIAHVGGTKNPDLASIVELQPDLVVMDREENRIDDATSLRASGLDLFISDVRSVADAGRLVVELAERVGRSTPPFVIGAPIRPTTPLRAFVPIWRRPWMSISADTYGASLLAHLGVDIVTADSTEKYPTVEVADVIAMAPDVVLVPSEPYEFEDRHIDELVDQLTDGGGRVQAVRIDGQDLFWWGTRTPAAIERLRAALRVQTE